MGNRKEAIEMLQAAFNQVYFRKNLDKRLKTAFDSLQDQMGNKYIMAMERLKYGQYYSITIWGNGIEWDKRIYLHISLLVNDQICSWQNAMKEQFQRLNEDDYNENYEFEKTFYSQLQEINSKIENLQKEALALKPSTYIPKCATLRQNSYYWKFFSEKTRKQFPAIFGG